MEDSEIIALYQARSERAITATAEKYGRYCRAIARGILGSREDSEECVNDTYLRAWNSIPPQQPRQLSAFLGRITRNLALDRYQWERRAKRGGGQIPLVLEELADCVCGTGDPEQALDAAELTDALNRFLSSLSPEARRIFLRRYWFLSPIREIAEDLALSESKVKMTLLRTRQALRQHLRKEGIPV